MPITATCPHCGHTVKAPDNAGGKKGKCPRCAGIVPIPDMPEIIEDDDDDSGFAVASSGFAPAAASGGFASVATTSPTPPPIPAIDDTRSKAKVPVPPGVIAMVVGKPATAWGYRSSFGRTTFALTSTRLLETTRRPIEERDCEMFIEDIDSVEMTAKGNPSFIAFGLTTIGMVALTPFVLIIPVICAVLFFLLKHRFLIIRSQANIMVLGVKGDERLAREFMQTLLAEVEHVRASR